MDFVVSGNITNPNFSFNKSLAEAIGASLDQLAGRVGSSYKQKAKSKVRDLGHSLGKLFGKMKLLVFFHPTWSALGFGTQSIEQHITHLNFLFRTYHSTKIVVM